MKAARYLNRRITRDVLKEDLEFCRWTNEGIHSSSYQAGLLSTLELGVRQFHEQIRELIPVAGCEESPPVGQIRIRNDELRADG
jgi:phenylpropionate dioxygenase-like ring-hydroxylating dioxygenase large terminal subunit